MSRQKQQTKHESNEQGNIGLATFLILSLLRLSSFNSFWDLIPKSPVFETLGMWASLNSSFFSSWMECISLICKDEEERESLRSSPFARRNFLSRIKCEKWVGFSRSWESSACHSVNQGEVEEVNFELGTQKWKGMTSCPEWVRKRCLRQEKWMCWGWECNYLWFYRNWIWKRWARARMKALKGMLDCWSYVNHLSGFPFHWLLAFFALSSVNPMVVLGFWHSLAHSQGFVAFS